VFDLGFTEIMLLGAIALIVLGPEKLPHAARMAGAWYGRIRRSISSIQREIEQEVNGLEMKQRVERELAAIRAAEQAMRDEINQIQAGVSTAMNPSDPNPPTATTTTSQPFDPLDMVYSPLSDTLRQQRFPIIPYRVNVTDTADRPVNLNKPENQQP